MNLEYIREQLSSTDFRQIFYYDSLDSTNTHALELLSENSVVIAGVQTAGKGRSSRVWESASQENLYFSIVLPDMDIAKLLPLNIVAGYSLCDTVRNYQNAFLKWPNDLIIDGKKAGGLLIETKFSGNQMDKIVLGVGINVNSREFPDAIKNIATSISVGQRVISLETIFVEFMQVFHQKFHQLLENSIDIVFDWKQYSAYLGKSIRVHVGDEKKNFIERGINPNGGLIVEDNSGKLSEIYTGDIGYDFCS